MTKDEQIRRAEWWDLIPGCTGMRRYEMMEDALSTFIYKDLPDTLPVEWLEGYLVSTGHVGIGKVEGSGPLYCAPGSWTGDYNGYMPTEYRALVIGKGQIAGTVGENIVVGWNNAIRRPDFDIWHTADMLTEVDISEKIVTIFTRLLRIPKAKSDAEKEAIEEAIKALLVGDLTAVASDNTLQDLMGSSSDDRFLDLIDPQQVDQLQYLNQFRDNLLKRFMQRRGHSMTVTSKLAQQTNAEMHGADSYSMIYPLQQLHYRQRMLEDIKRVFPDDISPDASVEFSDIVKNQYDLVINYIPDELNERSVIGDEKAPDGNSGADPGSEPEPDSDPDSSGSEPDDKR